MSGLCRWNPVELVEALMLPQPDRLALHFEIPAVLDRLLSELAICRHVAFAVFVAGVCDLLTGRLQLVDQSLETTADARQRGGALFLQLLEEALVFGAGVVDSHGRILSDLLHILQLDSPFRSVTFSLSGFSNFRREGIELTGSFTATVDAEMRVGGLQETVTVTGASPICRARGAR